MASLSGFLFIISTLYILHSTTARDCTKDDVKEYKLPCNQTTGKRKIISYLDTVCDLKDASLIKQTSLVFCDCPPGQGLTKDLTKCKKCQPGYYNPGGEDFSDWASWTSNGTVPPANSDIHTYCETYRSYVRPCEHWKASYFNDTVESGDNAQTRCMSSILIIRKQFVSPDSYVTFSFRVEGRKCYTSYVGCDGLGFFVDNKKVMDYKGNQFVWKTARYNVSAGFHQLKWVYRKNCYSFPYKGMADKAFIRAITMVGTLEPEPKCKPCPAGSYNNQSGATACEKCSYFQYQPVPGETSCKLCPPDSYSMLGAAYCIPLIKCTTDDHIVAPESLNKCFPRDNIFYRKIDVSFSYVTINNTKRKLCLETSQLSSKVKNVQCKCQPGYKLIKDPANPKKAKCVQCKNSMHSADGRTCTKCPAGHIAMMGKHYYTWVKDELPEGFSAQCSGDCSVKTGWISSGDHVRTSRVVGDVLSFIQTPEYTVISNIARINFTCAVVCNITEPVPNLPGNHLADVRYCNLVFQVWSNGSLADQVNCTRPRMGHVYRHERKRDGTFILHSYPLKRGTTYQFRWVFNQADELKSTSLAFEGKLYNISIFGIKGGSAMNCTPCAAGSYSDSENTDCSTCPKGTYSERGASTCTTCKNGTFADKPGSGKCLVCGLNTLSLPTRDGCTDNNCLFSPAEGVEYDFSMLSRENGPMFEVLPYQVSRGPASRRSAQGSSSGGGRTTNMRRLRISSSYLSIWPPYRQRYYINLCTVKHENSSCTFFNTTTGVRESLPVMGCRTSWWSRRDLSIGRVIGFKPKKDIRSGVFIALLHGDRCYSTPEGKYTTTIDLQCDLEAGVGSPGPENNYTQVLRRCNYHFVWRSLYACPKCRKQDFEKVRHPCVDGIANVTISKKIPCWGKVDGVGAGTTNVSCSYSNAKILKIQSTVNRVLIGVGVVIIIVLIVIAGYFFYKHRDIRYKYYSTLARNKPMSKLEEEEEDFGQVEGDVFHDSHNIVRG